MNKNYNSGSIFLEGRSGEMCVLSKMKFMDSEIIMFAKKHTISDINTISEEYPPVSIGITFRDRDTRYFEYQFRPSDSNSLILNVLDCLISEMDAFESCRDLSHFITKYGFTGNDDIRNEGEKAYKLCETASENLHYLFSKEEINRLRTMINIKS